MNISVQADLLVISVSTEMVSPEISSLIVSPTYPRVEETVCLPLTYSITVNGHSISAINPEVLKVGELTTSLAA